MASKRRIILTTLQTAINQLAVTGLPLTITAITTPFDPLQREADFPLFGIVSEPETITVSLSGVRKDRTMRVAMIGFALAPVGEVFLDGEDIADEIVQALTSQTNVNLFHDAFTGGCGFSVVDIGPIVVEQFEFEAAYVYMSVPCSIQYIDP